MELAVALLTGGSDKPYALGLASALAARRIALEIIGSDELDCREIRSIPGTRLLNLRGEQREDVPLRRKAVRILNYYGRLLRYAAGSRPSIFHILWNNRFEVIDRMLLMACYRAAGKRIVLTVHNVNAAARDGCDTWLNRATLGVQYRLCDHLFVHTEAMKRHLISGFGVHESRITIIPFGINETIPTTMLTRSDARQRLGLDAGGRVLLFFGQIAPYKGLEYLIAALARLAGAATSAQLVIAGKIKRGSEEYWRGIERSIATYGLEQRVIRHIGFVPDDRVEPYFKAADAVVMPYVEIFQSGVPFLAFNFGVPVIASDVGSLRDDITAETGMLCRPKDPNDLARAIVDFYASDLYRRVEHTRTQIRTFAAAAHSWEIVGERTRAVYECLAHAERARGVRFGLRKQRRPSSECLE